VIQETSNRKNEPAITSNQWHVVHAKWSGDPNGKPLFLRSIVSEHDDQAAALGAREALAASLVAGMTERSMRRRIKSSFESRPTSRSRLRGGCPNSAPESAPACPFARAPPLL